MYKNIYIYIYNKNNNKTRPKSSAIFSLKFSTGATFITIEPQSLCIQYIPVTRLKVIHLNHIPVIRAFSFIPRDNTMQTPEIITILEGIDRLEKLQQQDFIMQVVPFCYLLITHYGSNILI